MEEFFDIDKLETYKGWLKKIVQYFNYERVKMPELWDLLSNEMSFNEGKWYDLKLSLMFLYDNLIGDGNDVDSIDTIEYIDVERFLVDYNVLDNYDTKHMALSESLDIPPFLLVEQGYSGYGDGLVFKDMTKKSYNEYIIYDEDEIDQAYDEWKDEYLSNSTLDDLYDIEYYIETDTGNYAFRELIEGIVDDTIENYDDSEILERTGYDNLKSETEEAIEKFKSDLEDVETDIDDLEGDIIDLDSDIDDLISDIDDFNDDNIDGDYDDEIDGLEQQIEDLREKIENINEKIEGKKERMDYLEDQIEEKNDDLENILEDAKDDFKDDLTRDIESDIEDDPLDYLTQHYGLSYSDIVDYGYGEFEEQRYKDDMLGDEYRAENLGGGYDEDEITYDGVEYIIYNI